MTTKEDIKTFLESKKRTYVPNFRLRPSDQTIMLYIPNEKILPKIKQGFTSIRQLNNIKNELTSEFSINAEMIFVKDDSQLELESSLYHILNRKFNNKVISLYISFRDEQTIDIFIEVSQLDEEIKEKIKSNIEVILEDIELDTGKLNWLYSLSDLPTIPAILRALKTLQPVNLPSLKKELQTNCSPMSSKWLSHKLDFLRKKNYIFRQKENQTYVLTDKALGVVPSGTKRSSSDIERALAFTSRKW